MECGIAAVAIERMLTGRAGIQLGYAAGLPRETTPEGAWTERMAVPFLMDFDRREKVSAIPHCPGLRRDLEARGVIFVEGLALQQRLPDKTAVVQANLPVLSDDRKGAMVRVEVLCGSGCLGSAYTFYLVLKDDTWAITAMRAEWMASPQDG